MSDEMNCKCGRKGRYYHTTEGHISCNKYMLCLSYDELYEANKKHMGMMSMYQQSMNRIDDYFEHSMKSKEDQKKVHQILVDLNEALAKYNVPA